MANTPASVEHEAIRILTTEERKATHAYRQGSLPEIAKLRKQPTCWYPLHDPMTSGQVDSLSPAEAAGDTRTALLWVQFKHPRTRQRMISEGRFDYDGGTWWVRVEPGEDGLRRKVTALAWARVKTDAKWTECLPVLTSTIDGLEAEG